MTLAEQSQSNAAAHSAQPGAAPSQQSQNTQRAELRENAMLKHGRSTFTSDILGAMTTKHNQVFMLTTNGGDIPPDNSGLGLYFRDTRYLGRLELRLEGLPLTSLLANPSRGDSATFELTNPDLPLPNGGYLPKERLSVRREQRLDERVSDTLALHNLSTEALDLELTVTVGSAFTNMFVVRGAKPGKRGTVQPPAYQEGALRLVYDGADHHRRTTTLRFDPTPDGVDIPAGAGGDSATVRWSLRLEARAERRITLTIELADDDLAQSKGRSGGGQAHSPATGASRRQDMIAALDHLPQVETNNPLFDLALQRSFNDLRMLAMADHGDLFFAAGVPWYVALFGRDSLITAFETLAFQPAIARSTLEVLAQYQGTERNDFQDEEPGKILHELRVGEKANLHEVPQIPYYGTVDATPWFLILLHEYVR